MIYFDNIIFSLQSAGGISSVWSNLIQNINLNDDSIRYIEYDNVYQNLFRKECHIPPEQLIILKHFNKIFSQFSHPQIKNEQNFIFHSSYFRTCNNPNAINVTTLHDFIYEQGNPTWKERLRIAMNYRAVRKSDVIVCVSENTKNDLLKFIPDVDPAKVHVIYNGVSEAYFKMDTVPYPEYRDYVLFVGGRQGYKNFDFTVRAVENSKYRLLVCGSPLNSGEKKLLDESLENRYKIMEYPTNAELNKVYNSVFCLAYPSSYEGFGIPILEAQRCGCPIIAMLSSSVPEVMGAGGIMMDKLVLNDFENALAKLEETSSRKELINAGLENVKRFSWKKMAEEYLALYNSILN